MFDGIVGVAGYWLDEQGDESIVAVALHKRTYRQRPRYFYMHFF